MEARNVVPDYSKVIKKSDLFNKVIFCVMHDCDMDSLKMKKIDLEKLIVANGVKDSTYQNYSNKCNFVVSSAEKMKCLIYIIYFVL